MRIPQSLREGPAKFRLNLPCIVDAPGVGRKVCVESDETHGVLCYHRSPDHPDCHCSREAGHEGPHVACNSWSHSIAVWDNDGSPGVPRETDAVYRQARRAPELAPEPVNMQDVAREAGLRAYTQWLPVDTPADVTDTHIGTMIHDLGEPPAAPGEVNRAWERMMQMAHAYGARPLRYRPLTLEAEDIETPTRTET